MRRWSVPAALALIILALAVGVARAGPAQAHGKEVQIQLRCGAANAAVPLEQRCEAIVVSANDGDPVSDAKLLLSAVRSGKGDRVAGQPLEASEEPGRYEGTLSLPAYGTWVITAEVEAPAQGRVELTQEVLPPAGGSGAVSEARARLVVSFNGQDLANVFALAAHLLGAATLFAATGAVLLVGVVAQGLPGIEHRRRVARWFPWAAATSLLLIAASGVYNALYNAPTRSPGLLHPGTISDLPFGEAYLIAFGVKMALTAVLVLGTAVLAIQLRRAVSWLVPPMAGGAQAVVEAGRTRTALIAALREDACVSLAAVNLAVGGILLVTVLVIGYLHLLSHAGALAGV